VLLPHLLRLPHSVAKSPAPSSCRTGESLFRKIIGNPDFGPPISNRPFILFSPLFFSSNALARVVTLMLRISAFERAVTLVGQRNESPFFFPSFADAFLRLDHQSVPTTPCVRPPRPP